VNRFRLVAAGLALALLLAGCFAPGGGDQPGQAGPTLPTPQASLSSQVDGTVSLVRAALALAGLQLNPPVIAYRPSEPAGLATAPRAVLQVTLPGAGAMDPDQGYVLIYDLTDTATAADRGRELAAYLGSGFGQTNYPLDAQFAISQVGGTLVFTWWSANRAADRALAKSAFDAVASVGQPIPVVK
jgi:hypothetical protein